MKPESNSILLLTTTRTKAKMYEYSIPLVNHNRIVKDPARLLILTIGILGDVAKSIINEDINQHEIKDQREKLLFSAQFFDSYVQSRLNNEIDPYLLLVGSASYYLCDLPGNSFVLIKKLGEKYSDRGDEDLENLLLNVLSGKYLSTIKFTNSHYSYFSNITLNLLNTYFENGKDEEELIRNINDFRNLIYSNGSPRQLLLIDVIYAVIKKKISNSLWRSLPEYTNIHKDLWSHTIKTKTPIQEFWPAQHLLGRQNIFKGKSGSIQMPTSAGKTRATEFIIRSLFISDKNSLAIIVAPFKALCNELSNSFSEIFKNDSIFINEISDVPQKDVDVNLILKRKQVLIVTPEKLLYMLRQSPEIINEIGLLIYDEGHQFDNGGRGITYELLLTTLKLSIPSSVQSVLISAVVNNIYSIGNWLNGDTSEIVYGNDLTPTFRTIAFTSWVDEFGKLEFTNQNNIAIKEFSVPRVIEQKTLVMKKRERRKRFFPEKNNVNSISLYLGIKLVPNGSIAIFCGRKITVTKLCENIIESYRRELDLLKPIESSDKIEIGKLHYLYAIHLGEDSVITKAVELGILTHHGNIPQGIRLAVEHSMQHGKAKFVICTSTLAQGVNLPIKYLIVNNVFQGNERIKTRDFQNLIGRTGRSGMHTEGSIIFADSSIYDQRNIKAQRWKFNQVEELLDEKNSEPCQSMILKIIEPFRSDSQNYYIPDSLSIIEKFVTEPELALDQLNDIALQHEDKGFGIKGLRKQLTFKMEIIEVIESFLMTHMLGSSFESIVIDELVQNTLGYYLANEKEKEDIKRLFEVLARNILKLVPEEAKRKKFSKTLYGIRTSIEIEEWLTSNINLISICNKREELISVLWKIIEKYIKNKVYRSFDKPEILIQIANLWISGETFKSIHQFIINSNAKINHGDQKRQILIDHTVDICENALSYEVTLILASIIEIIKDMNIKFEDNLLNELKEIQKSFKYGLSCNKEIIIYELGFSDRVVSKDIGNFLDVRIPSKENVIRELNIKINDVQSILTKYPSYFLMILNKIKNEE